MRPVLALAQKPKAATYITAEEVKPINALPGVDRQIVNVDVGNTEPRGRRHSSRQDRRAAGRRRPRRPAAAARRAAPPEPCGEKGTALRLRITDAALAPGADRDLHHHFGIGTLVTGGKVMNGRKSAPDSQVTKVLNGPSCSGSIVGDDVVQEGRQGRRHHHHSGGHAARLGRHPRSRRLPERASGSAAHDSRASTRIRC